MADKRLEYMIFGIEKKANPVYFKLCIERDVDSNSTPSDESAKHVRAQDIFGTGMTSSLCVLMSKAADESRPSYSQREAELSNKIELCLKDGFPPGHMVALHAHTGSGHFERGFLVMGSLEEGEALKDLHQSDEPEWTLKIIDLMKPNQGSLRYLLLYTDRRTKQMRCRVVSSLGTQVGTECLTPDWLVVPQPRPLIHPAFMQPQNNSLYTSLQQVMEILNQCRELPGVAELRSIAERELHVGRCASEASALSHPFIVIEGLDGTGKSTLTRTLASRMSALHLNSPPSVLHPLRGHFDSLPPLLRRAYYTLGNYLVAHQVAHHRQTGPVVMDRFWHSTAAYTIATECAGGDETVIPPVDHQVYQWPSDLIVPSAVLMLNVSEHVREARLTQRLLTDEEKKTDEEERISQNRLFMRRILAAYRRMTRPAVTIVEADGTQDEVLKASIAALAQHGIDVDDTKT